MHLRGVQSSLCRHAAGLCQPGIRLQHHLDSAACCCISLPAAIAAHAVRPALRFGASIMTPWVDAVASRPALSRQVCEH